MEPIIRYAKPLPICIYVTIAAYALSSAPEVGRALIVQPVYVSGVVLDRATGHPAHPAMVFLDRLEGDQPAIAVGMRPCLANGSFTLKASAPGEYRLKVEREDQVYYQQKIQVPASGSSGLRIAIGKTPVINTVAPVGLRPSQASSWKIGLQDEHAQPLRTSQVECWTEIYHGNTEYGAGGSMPVNAAGEVALNLPAGLPADQAEIVITVHQGTAGWGKLRCHQWTPDTKPLSLGAEPVLHGLVVDRYDKPTAGVNVLCTELIRVGCTLRRAERLTYCSGVTDSTGHFNIMVPAHGTYDVRGRFPDKLVCHCLFNLDDSRRQVTLSARDDPVDGGALTAPEFVQD